MENALPKSLPHFPSSAKTSAPSEQWLAAVVRSCRKIPPPSSPGRRSRGAKEHRAKGGYSGLRPRRQSYQPHTQNSVGGCMRRCGNDCHDGNGGGGKASVRGKGEAKGRRIQSRLLGRTGPGLRPIYLLARSMVCCSRGCNQSGSENGKRRKGRKDDDWTGVLTDDSHDKLRSTHTPAGPRSSFPLTSGYTKEGRCGVCGAF